MTAGLTFQPEAGAHTPPLHSCVCKVRVPVGCGVRCFVYAVFVCCVMQRVLYVRCVWCAFCVFVSCLSCVLCEVCVLCVECEVL